MSVPVFDKVYAGAYDALYQDKDYEAECDFLSMCGEAGRTEISKVRSRGAKLGF